MTAPIVRDVDIRIPRSGAAGSQGAVQEATISCFTGRHATACTVVAEYGPTTAYGTSTAPSPAGGSHALPLGDLTPGTTYHARLVATDPTDVANPTTTQDYSWLQPPDVVPPGPTLTTIASSGVTATGATVTWTSAPACPNGQVNYGTSPSLEPLSVGSEVGTGTRTAHTVTLAGLTAATRYYYRVFQVAPDGASTLSSLRTFVTA